MVAIDKSKFVWIKVELSGQNLLQILVDDIFICYVIKYLFIYKPSFERYTKVDEAFKKIIYLEYPNDEKWEKLVKLVGKVDIIKATIQHLIRTTTDLKQLK